MLISKYLFLITRLFSQIWVKITFYSLIAMVTPFAANALGPLFSNSFIVDVGAQSVETVLNIIASSMLAVSTFSLGIMASAFASAAQSTTPRATQLLLEDRSSQNVLATFLGSFVFSLVSIIALQIGVYNPEGRVILLATTIAILAIVFTAFIRWISLLRIFGRIPDTIKRVEHASGKAIEKWQENPFLGCIETNGTAQKNWHEVCAEHSCHVQHIDFSALDEIGFENDIKIFIIAHPGVFACPSIPLVRTNKPVTDELTKKIRKTFFLASERSFQQDPEFGFIVLAETASRALSSGLNDAGTAIDIVYRGLRLFERLKDQKKGEVKYQNLLICPLDVAQIAHKFYDPIMRDGKDIKEVQDAISISLSGLKQIQLFEDEKTLHKLFKRQLAYIRSSELLEDDKKLLEERITTQLEKAKRA